MSNSSKIDKKTNDSAAELFRLSLTRLGKLRLSITPVNYSLIYFYLSGDNLALNEKLDELFLDIEKWNDEKAEKLLNFKATTPLLEGLRRVVDWRKSQA